MKIVTYNVNGLRPRISQFGSLLKFLGSLDADIICVQETKLSRHELTADVVMADGYESFFSCTRTNSKGRVGYSGVATFCRVKSAFSSTEVALPIAAEEGFTGLLEKSGGFGTGKDEIPVKAEGLEEFAKDELLKVDSEGRCIITDHGHFVLFNIYGPRADSEDTERIQFKHTFFQILQKRWETLQQQGRRIFVVGDLNIAPAAIDRCDAGSDFEKNEFRRWFRSMLVECGGPFFDVFRAKHPDRREAYTCWSSSTGAEEFNYGSRIDHILSSGSCLHQDHCLQDHIFVTCHVKECDILTQFKRWKPGNKPSFSNNRWKGGRSIKLEGSDHAPVFMSLMDIPDVAQHSTPSLSARYVPTVHGFQQTIASVLMKRQKAEQVKTFEVSSSFSDENITTRSCSEILKRSSQDCCISDLPSGDFLSSSNLQSEGVIPRLDGPSICSISDSSNRIMTASIIRQTKSTPGTVTKKKARQSQCSQLSVKSFFQKSSNVKDGVDNAAADASLDQADESKSNQNPNKTSMGDDESKSSKMVELDVSASNQEQDVVISGSSPQRDKNDIALVEWQRIQQLMQNSIPLCKGHGEPCVSRVAKKPGPNHGRRFYVCARAEGPASNPETNCGYFKWAASKSRHR
ncbi:DNA-(apurinic or apyrimidinic site) lyase 2 isoform X1 [Vitis riparia]|uniref:DNA-(apurinic or apyrimidinic site) lyase 2 isoform X1 n=1 Tax=Vitis riparia TaxID=96939 RepID=UPI00155B0423|nr:DNA-(apurinic or apyrimidinic site) lyase 2 isoform X1 [Vitis riparia]XP_034684008.1 DNA-(apurinic or apyrimidinic site) lyase 2 isoform X1 [Vitis riparia]XP_034684009.1 DNA-(apurinic or apyrimidinic site) lyase 2 isoform X1 [Vitis riparia]